MANWSNPTLTSLYTDFLNELKARDTDLALQFDGVTTSNLPTGAIRWNSTANRWQKWNGTAWAELTTIYALTGLSTTGNASIGGTLTVTGSTALAAATATTPVSNDNSTAVATTAYVRAQAYATLASPALTGTPTAPTAAADTNTTQLATTAFVLGQGSSTTPVMNGTAAVGTALRWARADHVHPTDTSRAPLASPTFTGTPVAPTAAVSTNTTQLATTAFVLAQIANDAPSKTGTGASGTWGISVTGNAGTATALATARTINGVSFDGSANITITASTPQALTAGSFITSTGTFDGSTARTFAVDATSANTASKVVARDASGNFSAGTITANLTGTASGNQPVSAELTAIAGLAGTSGLLRKTAAGAYSLDTATYLTANQSITLSGDATGSGTTAIAVTLANSGVTAGTYRSVTVDAKGRVTAGTNPTTLSGYGITDALALSGGTLTGQLLSSIGSVAAPGIAFAGDTNTGIYRQGSGSLGISTGGQSAAYFTSTYQFNLGGIYISNADDIAATSVNTLYDSSSLVLRGKYWNGTASANGEWLVFNDMTAVTPSSTLRFRWQGNDKMTLTEAGNLVVTGTLNPGGVIISPVGSVSAPSLTFSGDTNTGLYRHSAGTLGIATGGTTAVTFDTNNQTNYGNVYILTANDAAATSTTTTIDSGVFYLRGKYWNGTASANAEWSLINDVTSSTPVPAGSLRFRWQGVEKLSISDGGLVTAPAGFSGFLNGNATTATTWQTGRTISLTGDVAGTSGAIDGSANVSFAAAIQSGVVTASKLSGAQTGSAPIYGARAWVNFNGTGTVAIRASGNVTSITDNGVGDYTVNFTTAMPDANYGVAATSTGVALDDGGATAAAKTASALRFSTFNLSAARSDYSNVSVAIFR